MKKIIISSICLLALLAGCSGSKGKEKVCSMTQGENNELKEDITISYDGDKVSSITTKTVIDTEKASSDIKVKDLEKYAKDIEKVYNKIDGVKYTYESKDKTFNDKITVDITEKNMKELKEKGMINMYLDKDQKLLKTEQLVKYLEDSGMKCK